AVDGDRVALDAHPVAVEGIHERPQLPNAPKGSATTRVDEGAPLVVRAGSANAAAASTMAGATSPARSRERSITPDSNVVVSKRPARNSGSRVSARKKSMLVTTPCTTVSSSAAESRAQAVSRSGPHAAILARMGS